MTRRLPNQIACSCLLLAALSSFPTEVRAAPITIDFDAAAPCYLCTSDYFENGFHFTVVTGHYDFPSAEELTVTGATSGLLHTDTFAGGHSVLRLDLDGQHFDYLGSDVMYWAPHPEGPLDEAAFITSSAGGYAAITGAGSMTFTGPEWLGVSWIEFNVIDPDHDTHQDNLAFDNIRVNVPEPASALLLILGVIATAGIPRRFNRRARATEESRT